MRAQVALEYLIIFAVMLSALLPLVFWADKEASVATTASHARLAADSIENAANSAYVLGVNSVVTADVNFPQGYIANESILGGLTNKGIYLKFRLPDGNPMDILRYCRTNISGTLPNVSGIFRLSFTFNASGSIIVRVI